MIVFNKNMVIFVKKKKIFDQICDEEKYLLKYIKKENIINLDFFLLENEGNLKR